MPVVTVTVPLSLLHLWDKTKPKRRRGGEGRGDEGERKEEGEERKKTKEGKINFAQKSTPKILLLWYSRESHMYDIFH